MKARIAIIAGVVLCGSVLVFTATAAYAETTPNNSGRPLENLQRAPQGAADIGYFVGAGGRVAEAKATRSKARHHR